MQHTYIIEKITIGRRYTVTIWLSGMAGNEMVARADIVEMTIVSPK